MDVMPRLSEVRRKESLDSPAYLELARTVRPFMANFIESFGYANCLPVRHGWHAAVPAQARTWTWGRTF